MQPKPEEGDQGQAKEDESVAQPEFRVELNQSKELAENRPGPILGENGSALQTLNLDCNKLNDSQVTHVETTDRMMPLQDSIFGDTIDLPGPQAYATQRDNNQSTQRQYAPPNSTSVQYPGHQYSRSSYSQSNDVM